MFSVKKILFDRFAPPFESQVAVKFSLVIRDRDFIHRLSLVRRSSQIFIFPLKQSSFSVLPNLYLVGYLPLIIEEALFNLFRRTVVHIYLRKNYLYLQFPFHLLHVFSYLPAAMTSPYEPTSRIMFTSLSLSPEPSPVIAQLLSSFHRTCDFYSLMFTSPSLSPVLRSFPRASIEPAISPPHHVHITQPLS